jgi:cobalt/nickel transport system ATP-binding protein
MSSPTDVFVVDDAHYRYLDRFVALAGVSLTITAGERVALLGSNGCGKSTLLKLLSGLIEPERGTVHAFGTELSETTLDDEQFARAFRARVGLVFQSSDAQLFSPTVRDEVSFGPLHLGFGLAETERRVDDLLELLDIADLADRAPYQLSGGEKKRVAIASVLVTNPDVLLFDEPTAALDPRTQQWLLDLVVELHQAGKTIVCATHDLATLDQVADRCIVFSEEHRVVATGSPAEILADGALLEATNLVHVHTHQHDRRVHSHLHGIEHHRDPHESAGASR